MSYFRFQGLRGCVVQISAANLVIDLVRVCVVNFKAESMPILLAQANLEAVVAAGEDVG